MSPRLLAQPRVLGPGGRQVGSLLALGFQAPGLPHAAGPAGLCPALGTCLMGTSQLLLCFAVRPSLHVLYSYIYRIELHINK